MQQDRLLNGEERWQTLGKANGLFYYLLLILFMKAKVILEKFFALSRRERPVEKKGNGVSSSKLVRYVIGFKNPPPLTERQKAELAALAARPKSAIDYSDIPPLTEKFWKNAKMNPFYKPRKTPTTLRIDMDVLAWLRSQGSGYQSRINAILRREMLAALKH